MSAIPPMPPLPLLLLGSTSDEWFDQIRSALSAAPLCLDQVRSGKAALQRLASPSSDTVTGVLVDFELEDMSGLALCRRIRENRDLAEMPFIMVSRLSDEMDRVLCFENGVDDFVAEPFFARELHSRIQALLRRHNRAADGPGERNEARFGELGVDLRRGLVERDGEGIPLTTREFQVFRALVVQEGRVVRREELVDELHGSPGAAGPRVIDTHVKAIRHKLGPSRWRIETVRGVGYRFSGADEPEGWAAAD